MKSVFEERQKKKKGRDYSSFKYPGERDDKALVKQRWRGSDREIFKRYDLHGSTFRTFSKLQEFLCLLHPFCHI